MDLQSVKNIIDDLAKKDKIFSNEQDFQFELATSLKNEPDIVSVNLEVFSIDFDFKNDINSIKKENKKEYTDIIIKDKNGDYYAYELKYKMGSSNKLYNTKNGDILTLKQGAYDLGAYGFIYDIFRLEKINKQYFGNSIEGKIKKSFAILLTNDKNYRKNDLKGRKNIWTEYSIREKRKEIPNKLLTFQGTNQEYKIKSSVYKALKLANNRTLNWYDYKAPSGNGDFSYLIVEIDY